MQTLNNLVACTPFESTSIKVGVKSGVPFIEQKKGLTQLKVVFEDDCEDFSPGDTVWVRGDAMAHPYAKEVFEVDGKQFILIPRNMILGRHRE